MVKIGELYNYLNEITPFELQEKWDNSGLLVGNLNKSVDKIYLSIDLDLDLISEVEDGSLIITHHPLIFKPLRNLVGNDFATKILLELVKRDISLISLHTNFDKTHLNRYVATEVLNFDIVRSDDFILYFNINDNFNSILENIKDRLKVDSLNYVKCKDEIKTIALTTGSGMSLLDRVDADLFLTGDIKYHDAMDAKVIGISLIDITHYESEKYFGEALYKSLGDFQEYAIITNSKNPFKRS